MLEGSRNLLLVYGAGAVIGPTLTSIVMSQAGPGSLLLMIISNLLFLAIFTLYRMGVREPVSTEDQVEFVAVVRTSPVALELDPRIDVTKTD